MNCAAQVEQDAEGPKPSRILVVNSLFVIGICAVLTYGVSHTLFAMRSPFEMGLAMILLPGIVAVGLLQYYATLGRRGDCALLAGVFYVLPAASVLVMLLLRVSTTANVRFMVCFGAIALGFVMYSVLSVVINIRWALRIRRSSGQTKRVLPCTPRAKRGFWVLVSVFFLLFVAGGIHGAMTARRPPSYGENVPTVSWLPKSATDVSYYRSYMYTAFEFNIPEEDFLVWAKHRWKVSAIENEVISVSRYNWPILDTPQRHKEFETRETEGSVKIKTGYVHKEIWEDGGRIIVAYDSERRRAYYQHSPR